MDKKLMFVEAAPLISVLYGRAAITAAEKKALLESLRGDPENKQARAILARKLLEDPDASDVRMLYEKIRE